MGQHILKTVIALSGHVDNSVGRLGDAILNIGNQVDTLSQKVINFGKESIEEYVAYDDVMREVQALGEYENSVIDSLHDYNKAIAQTSQFTMQEAGHAEVLMAQLGLNLDQTQMLMPTVMDLATAANIDLADSLDYLYYTLNALGQPLEFADDLADQMSKTAAISAADIDTLGESLQRLGSGAQYFAGGSSEVLAILGGISKFGEDMQGSNAGTQLRNFMLTLLAPTASKEKLMAELGVTEEAWSEFETYMEDAGINVTDTAAAMNELGLSMYDSNGKLKPAIQIIGELKAALSSLSKEDQKEFLGKMFGKRTTITAENLLAAYETIIAYQKQIQDGSDGYTEYMAAIMEAGLGGTLRSLNSSWNALQVVVGDTLEPDVNFWATGLESIVDSVANLDEAKLSALVGAGEGLAIAGPGLMIAGGAFKLIGWAMNGGGWALGMAAGAVAVSALVKYLNKLNEIDLESGFGSMELDTTALTGHLSTVEESFKAAYGEVNTYNESLETALSNYGTATTTLSGKLTTAMITGATLTQDDIDSMQALGTAMGTELLNGIEASFNSSAAYLEMLYNDAENSEAFLETGALFGLMYDSVIGDAKRLGQDFGTTLGEAMDDGIITGDEYTVIMEKMRAYSEAIAIAAGAENAGEIEKSLFNAATVSWDSAESFLSEAQVQRDALIAESNAEHAYQVGQLKYWYQQAHDKGIINPFTGKVYTVDLEDEESDLRKALDDMNGKQSEVIKGIEGGYANVFDATFNAMFSTAGDSAYTYMHNLLAAGGLALDENNHLPEGFDYAAYLPSGVSMDEVLEGLHWMNRKQGDFADLFEGYVSDEKWAEAQMFFGLALAVREQLNSKGDIRESPDTYDYDTVIAEFGNDQEQAASSKAAVSDPVLANLRNQIAALSGTDDSLDAIFAAIGSGDYDEMNAAFANATIFALDTYDAILASIADAYNIEDVLAGSNHAFAQKAGELYTESPYRTDYAAYSLLYGDASSHAEDYSVYGDADKSIQVLLEVSGAEKSATEAMAEAQAVADGGITVPITFTGPRSNSFQDLYIQFQNGDVPGMDLYADGGRTAKPAIFGDAGPEWAIPEEHSTRTASLLNAAREASGFTWPELIERNGGLNAGRSTPTQIIYSPTIYAKDARGVEQKLIEDKARLDRWWAEKQLRDEVEVYA